MRQMLADAGAPSPDFKYLSLTEDPQLIASEVSYPCVLKPLFLSGSRGVIRADDSLQFIEAFRRISALLRTPEIAREGRDLADHILIEEYVPGKEVAVEGLALEGTFKLLAIFDKPDPLEGPYFEETIYVTPSRLGRQSQDLVLATTAAAMRALGINHGPVHAELRLNARGAWVVEITPRSIGGHCSRALRFDDGLSLEQVLLRQALGEDLKSIEREKSAAGVMMMPIPAAGTLLEIRGQEAARAVPGVEDILFSIPVGEQLVPLPEAARYLGFIFARAETPEQVEKALRQAHARLDFRVAPD